MNRNKSAAGRHEIEQRFFLVWRNPRVIGENGQAIETRELRRTQIIEPIGVNEFDAADTKNRLQLFETISGLMMASVAEEQNPQLLGCARGIRLSCAKQTESKGEGAKQSGATKMIPVIHEHCSYRFRGNSAKHNLAAKSTRKKGTACGLGNRHNQSVGWIAALTLFGALTCLAWP